MNLAEIEARAKKPGTHVYVVRDVLRLVARVKELEGVCQMIRDDEENFTLLNRYIMDAVIAVDDRRRMRKYNLLPREGGEG